MASSSGNSSGSSKNCGSDEDLQVLMMDQRKRKRMISNRESARRSRMRKQKHLDELVAQVAHLRNENQKILTRVNLTTQQFLTIEAENSVLRAQANELTHRLESLNEIVDFVNTNSAISSTNNNSSSFLFFNNNNNPLNMAYHMNQPIMASPDMFYDQY